MLIAVLLLAALFAGPTLSLAADPPSTPANTTRIGIWWKWDVSRDWSSQYRRARGSVHTYADAAATLPLAVDSLRFTLEIDCPASGGPERATFEAKNASVVKAEVKCPAATDSDFPVNWEFDAQDRRTGPVHDQGTWR